MNRISIQRMSIITVRKYPRENSQNEITCPLYSNACVWDTKCIIEVTQYHKAHD